MGPLGLFFYNTGATEWSIHISHNSCKWRKGQLETFMFEHSTKLSWKSRKKQQQQVKQGSWWVFFKLGPASFSKRLERKRKVCKNCLWRYKMYLGSKIQSRMGQHGFLSYTCRNAHLFRFLQGNDNYKMSFKIQLIAKKKIAIGRENFKGRVVTCYWKWG